MSDKRPSLGQAIDTIIEALEQLDPSAQKTAINAACSHLGIDQPVEKGSKRYDGGDADGISTRTDAKQMDIRSLKEEKAPKTAAQMACVVAYYLQEVAPTSERKESVNASDLDKYFKQAKFKLPKSTKQLLVDSKAAGYFDSDGKGEYSLNAVGYNLVAHNLPKTTNS